jgi:predicted GTPase
MRRVVVMGAGGRDFHDFNTVFREDDSVCVVAFTAAGTQVAGGEGRTYPPTLAGRLYPGGIPIHPEEELGRIVREESVDTVVLSYSGLSHEEVMHRASRVLAAGADFTLFGPQSTMLEASKPVVAVTAVRAGCGKSTTSRRVGSLLRAAGHRVGLVRHPTPHGLLDAPRVRRLASTEDIDGAGTTVEEREEYEEAVSLGLTAYTGSDYAAVLELAQGECDVLVWDGGDNDLPFFRPDLHVVVTDALQAGVELAFHPGEANLLRADVVVVNMVENATPAQVRELLRDVAEANPYATIVKTRSLATLDSDGRARYELQEVGRPTLADALAPLLRLLSRPASAVGATPADRGANRYDECMKP